MLPRAPEFERTSTTLVNAYVAPTIRRYLDNLRKKLRDNGYRQDLLLIQSNGGLMTASWVADRAVSMLGSGPAGGVVAACRAAEDAGVRDFISVDMGGTSYDVAVIREGRRAVVAQGQTVSISRVNGDVAGAGGGVCDLAVEVVSPGYDRAVVAQGQTVSK